MKQKILLFLWFSVAALTTNAQCVTNVNFNTWSQAGRLGNGSWSVQGGGTQIYQSVNAPGPTFFISPFDLMNVHITGNFRTTDNDNDWMGFVFSFLNPLAQTDSFDCWLFDWKKEQQDGASSGKSLCRVDGIVPPANYTPQFWDHTNSAEFTVIQDDFGGPGWTQGFNHAFEMFLTYNSVRINIDGVPTFAWNDCFKPGRFGFYNYSQSDCIYSNFQYELYVDFSLSSTQVCRGSQLAMNFTNSCVPVLNQYQTMTWNYGDGSPPLVINNPTLANVNTTHVYNTAGNYTATLTVLDNNGCSATASHLIDVRNPIVLTQALLPPPCNGGANGGINLSPSGGFGNYSYTWSNGTSQRDLVGASAGTYAVTVTDGICNTTGQYTLSQPSPLTATTSHIDAPCGSNGSVTINISGGTPPYSGVTWAGIAGNTVSLPAGTWIANFHDLNNCSALLQYQETIASLPCGINSSASSTNVTCFGQSNGTATLTVTGGSPPTNISWTGGRTGANIANLPAGTYVYTYSDANPANTFSGSVIVTQPTTGMSAQITTVPISCAGVNNGQAFASVTAGGVAPFSYAWSGGLPNSPSAMGLSPGAISVTVTDALGCQAIASGVVSGVPSLAATIFTVMDSCYHSGRGSATVRPSGGNPPYTYLWNNHSIDTLNNNLIAGTYVVTITDFNSCSITASSVVGGPSTPFAKSFTTQHISCFGGSDGNFNITVSGGTPGYTYTWSPGTVSGNNPTGLSAGIYNFTVNDSYGCILIGNDTLLQPDSALIAISSHTDISCNGAADGTLTLTIGGGTPPYTYQGTSIPAGTNTLSGFSAGTYAGTVTDARGCTVALSETIVEPAALSLSESHINLLCNGSNSGSITITAGGGTVPYTFAWNDSVTTQNRVNLAAGNYSVTCTDSRLCSATLSVTLTQPSVLAVVLTPVNALCNGASTGSITSSVSGGTPAYTYLWNDGDTNSGRTGIAAGIYSLVITDSTTCTASASATVSEPAALVVTSSHTDATCHGSNNGTITVNISGGTSPYSFLGNPVPGGTTIIPNLPPAVYAGNVTDANGCTAGASETITEPGIQSVTVSGTNNICFGATQGTASALFVNATGTVVYNWSGGLTGANISNLAAAVYTVTATDQNNCTATDSITITEPAAVTMTVSTTDAPCFGTNGTATATPNGGTAPFTYLWSNGFSGQTVSLPSGNYTVSSTDANTCQQTAALFINQPAEIIIQEIHTDVNCFGGATGSITLTISGGNGPNYTYTWLPNISTGNSASGLSAGTYNITITDQSSCTNDTAIVITEPAAPVTMTLQAQDITCFGAGDGIITALTSGGTPGYTYIWNPNVSTVDSATGLAVGTYDVTVNDLFNCSFSATAIISEPTAIVLTPSQTDLLCYQVNTGVARVSAAGGIPPYAYNWSPNVSASDSATGLAAGVYDLTVSDGNACNATVSFTISEPPQLLANEIHSNNLCFGTNTAFIIITPSGGTPGYTYQWSPAVSSNDSATNLPAGNYSVTVMDVNLCSATNNITITQAPQIAISATGIDAKCFGESSGSVSATATGGTTPYNFTLTTDWINYTPSASGQFQGLAANIYSVLVSDINSCVDSVSVTVNEPPLLSAAAGGIDVSCYGYSDGQINASGQGGAPGYTYALSTGANNNSGIFTGLNAGAYSITVTDVNLCTVIQTALINEPDSVTIFVTPDTISLDLGQNIQLQTNTNQTGILAYQWQPQFGLSCYDCANPLFTGNYSMNYTVTVINDKGCRGDYSFHVTVNPAYDVFIPNVFTPNGDGANDTWSLYGKMNGIKQLEVMVFNRWGEKVFESNDINFAWDGVYKGERVPPAVYVYVAKIVWLNNHSDNGYHGSITVIR